LFNILLINLNFKPFLIKMEITSKELREYLTFDGKCPFGDWLESLKDVKARAIIRVRLNRLRIGNFGDCKFIGEGVYELKIDFGSGYRVYFGQDGNILNHFAVWRNQKGTKP